MPRTSRKAPGGLIYHCLNRRVGRARIFHKPEDYAAFERVMAHALEGEAVKLLAYCIMPNHWHLLLRPEEDGQLGRFMQRLTTTHTRRYKEHYHQVGQGHLYQGRFKSFPVQDDRHFLTVARYVERNALRAGLVERAEQWPWGSLARRMEPPAETEAESESEAKCNFTLSPWPVRRPADYLQWTNEAQTAAEQDALRMSIARGRPFGDSRWQAEVTRRLGLESAYRPVGRPPARKPEPDASGKVARER
jgi:putative transposase